MSKAAEDLKVCIVGAGVAGSTAAYHLMQHGVKNITILEAAPIIGGRCKTMEPNMADFPIDVGGEWIHVNKKILDEITGIPGVADKTPTVYHRINDLRVDAFDESVKNIPFPFLDDSKYGVLCFDATSFIVSVCVMSFSLTCVCVHTDSQAELVYLYG